MNDRIRVPKVLLIDADGTKHGVKDIQEALAIAKAQEMDLVEVAPEADPPVCRVLDYARQTFEAKRRMKESRKKTKIVDLKEIKLKPKIDNHDYEIKMRKAREFMEKGHKVKFTMRYRNYELRHRETGLEILDRIIGDMGEVAEIDRNTRVNNNLRNQSIVLQPKKK